MIRVFKNKEVEQIVLDESTITSIKWLNENGINIEMDVDWCGQEDLKNDIDFLKVKTKLIFEFASDIDFNFKHSDTYTIGALEITDFTFKKNDIRYTIDIKFDFQPVGYIKFNCNDFQFVIEEK